MSANSSNDPSPQPSSDGSALASQGGSSPPVWPCPTDEEKAEIRRLMTYPLQIARHILSSADRGRFLANLSSKIMLRTMYAVMGSEGIALTWLISAVRLVEPDVISAEVLIWFSACDKSGLARRVLSAIPEGTGPAHIFSDILDRHCPEVRKDLEAVQWPSKPATTTPTLTASKRSPGSLPEPPAKHRCGQSASSEDSDCILLDPKASEDCGNEDSVDGHMTSTLNAIYETSAILARPEAFTENDIAPCYVHGKFCHVLPAGDDVVDYGLHLASGGMTCLDFTTMGKRAGLSGPSTKPCLSFRDSMSRDSVDIAVLECAPGWKPDLVTDSEVAKTHTLHSCQPRPCPSQFGWPFTRERYYGVLLRNNRRMVKSWEEFSSPFLEKPKVSGHAFYCDEPAHIMEDLQLSAGAHAAGVLPGEALNFEQHGLGSSQQSFLRFFREAHAKHLARLKAKGLPIPPGAEDLLADLHHNPDQVARFSTSGWAVGLLTHGAIWSDRLRRTMTKREILSLQGFATIPSVHGNQFLSPWDYKLDDLKYTDCFKLSGNGMHMAVLMLVLSWSLACTEADTA